MARKKRKQILAPDVIRPTPERERHNKTRSAGMARIVMPPIDDLLDDGTLTEAEYSALAYYRDQGQLADRSPVKSCLDHSMSSGHGPGVAILSAALETGRIERDLGELLDLARWVAVDDKTLEAWCIHKHGSRERYNGRGECVAVVPINEARHMRLAKLELKMAARRIVR